MEQVIQEMKSAPLGVFSVQLDESTDVANCSQLLVYVKYIYEGDFKDEFLFCKPLETTTTVRDVFDTVGSFQQNLTSLITVHMCMVWPCYCFVDGLS